MPRKIRKLSLAILFIIILGIGGKVYMDKREVQRQKDLLAVEKQSVKVLKNTFADIKEVKIEQFEKNDMTGIYEALITMTNTEGKAVYFDYSFTKESNEIDGYGVENEEVQKEGITVDEIIVIYTDGSEEKV
ncbi:TPA: hypothetical protein IW700_001587 [Enterococcus faecium]|uniref:hypothetical protein n=1 Tax=Enterococcus faecium TaxID=1352 RepID=UPI0003311C7F|nr:hypothetical protein [Enterococcus faecium]EOG07077.1 hypothetical protein SKO_01723 [Enterococcus faecium EnGen0170]EOM20194.1 hypothetical protein SSQ_01523 [Enterococcus faecium EnGen0193]NTL71958.1 hypothetical protein [Enterococcus faecium]TKM74159.1 hypothetical protein DVW80_03160 [Enterococcus faecium]HAQ0976420.1 hypothetical protein [Enterococcus faecium]